jgi:hypothetical protein
MNHKELNFDGMDWIYLAEGREDMQALVNTAMNFWIP